MKIEKNKRFKRQHLHMSTLAVAAVVFAAGSTVAAQEIEDSGPYYEDDAWYDVTEWLDGNDYNPTDEDAWRWDDEIYDAGEDVGDDQDSDDNYSVDTENRSPNYSYDNQNDDDNWFYDRYEDFYIQVQESDRHAQSGERTSSGTSQSGTSQPGADRAAGQVVYQYARVYRDVNGDGFYDDVCTYMDADQDGRFDSSRCYSFNTQGGKHDGTSPEDRRNMQQDQEERSNQNQSERNQLQSKSHQAYGPAHNLGPLMSSFGHELTGEIQKVKTVKVRNHEHQVVLLKPQVRPNATSAPGTNSERQEGADEQNPQRYQGSLQYTDRDQEDREQQEQDQRWKQQQDMQHEQDAAMLVAVDLGPKKALKDQNLEQGEQITVVGPLVRIGERPVILAQEFEAGGDTVEIDREGLTLEGKVKDGRTMSMRNQQSMILVMERDGRNYIVDLGPAQSFNATLREGDRVQVRGVPVQAGETRILFASCLTKNGKKTQIERHVMAGQHERESQSTKTPEKKSNPGY